MRAGSLVPRRGGAIAVAAPWAFVAAVCSAGCGACEPSPAQADGGAPSAAASIPVPPPPVSASAHPPAQRLACRAIAVEGDVHLEVPGADAGTVPLLIEGLVPTEGWLALGKGARFVAKDPRTTRETTFRGGPGRVRACVGYAEESWVASGRFESTMGSGEAPGQEEWVVTPLGVVRYASAKLSVDVRAKEASVAVGNGVAFVWPSEDAKLRGVDAGVSDGWVRLENATASLTAGAALDTLDAARAAVGACGSQAKVAHDLTSTLMAGGADAAVVTQQVTSRRLARSACDVAALRLAAVPPSEASLALGKSLAEANASWTSLGPGPQTNNSAAAP